MLIRAGSRPSEQRPRTFTEAARRAQIVEAATDVIAEVGYGNASFARIARRAGLSSTGVISYHFAGKEDLVREVVAEGYRVAEAFWGPRLEAAGSAAERLRAHIASNLELLRAHPRQVRALAEIFAARGEDGRHIVEPAHHRTLAARLEEALRDGQASGELRAGFDSHVMALTIRGAIGEAQGLLLADPNLDLDLYVRELATTFELATRRNA